MRFRATVTSLRRTPITGRYRPHIVFDFSTTLFGLTQLDDVEWPFAPGETKPGRVTMLGHADFKPVVQAIAPGVRFSLLEGTHEVARGVIDAVEERTLDLDG